MRTPAACVGNRSSTLSQLLATCCMAFLATTSPVSAEEMSTIRPLRTESLELPGLTAGCHICEWRPKLNQMPAPAQCGSDTSGTSKVGLFECGFAEDCQRQCHFLRCATD